jgi:hypothetical protein
MMFNRHLTFHKVGRKASLDRRDVRWKFTEKSVNWPVALLNIVCGSAADTGTRACARSQTGNRYIGHEKDVYALLVVVSA